MTIITLKDRDDTANTLISLQTWRRTAKECNQPALYDALSEAIVMPRTKIPPIFPR